MRPTEYVLPKNIRCDTVLGYAYFIDSTHPLANKSSKVYLHRHIASIKLGRWLETNEIVHHIDGNKLNNHSNNLQVLTHSEHATLHHIEAGRNVKTERVCPTCGSMFISREHTYCSIRCAILVRHNKLKDVTKEQLQRLVWQIPTTQVAQFFGVSDVAIGKKCKKLGVDKPPRGYWEKMYHGKLFIEVRILLGVQVDRNIHYS